jgi:hypothetical protein
MMLMALRSSPGDLMGHITAKSEHEAQDMGEAYPKPAVRHQPLLAGGRRSRCNSSVSFGSVDLNFGQHFPRQRPDVPRVKRIDFATDLDALIRFNHAQLGHELARCGADCRMRLGDTIVLHRLPHPHDVQQ